MMVMNRRIVYLLNSWSALPLKTSNLAIKPKHKSNISCCPYSTPTAGKVYTGVTDMYKGVTIDTSNISDKNSFSEKLDASLDSWNNEGKRCIWFRVDIKDSSFIPVLAQRGFNFHHAREGFVMMYKWMPKDSKPNLPPSCYLTLGVGAMVFNNAGKLLAVSEKNYNYPHWKLPGGYVERGEDIIDAAVREVREETGVQCTFQSVVTFRHTHNMSFGNSDIYVLVRMKALTDEIIISQREIRDCKWMDVDEYTNHPHVHSFNKFIINKALEYKAKNITIDFQKKTITWPTATRDMHYIVIE